MLNASLFLRGQDVLLQGFNRAILRKLVAAIIGLGGVGEDLDDEDRIQERVARGVFKEGATADDAGVRVEIATRRLNLDAHVGGVDLAGPIQQSVAELASDVHSDEAVLARAARHCENLAVRKLMTLLGRALEGEVLLSREPRASRCISHEGRFPQRRVVVHAKCTDVASPSFEARANGHPMICRSRSPRHGEDGKMGLGEVIKMRVYNAVIERDAQTGLFVGYIPGWPGAHSQGETMDELRANLEEVIKMLLEDGEPQLESEFVGTQTLRVA